MGTWLHNLHLQWFHPAPHLRCPHQSPWECPWTSPPWWTRRPHRRRSWHKRITANHRGGHDCPGPPEGLLQLLDGELAVLDVLAPVGILALLGLPGRLVRCRHLYEDKQWLKPLYFGKQNIPRGFRLCSKKPFLVGISLRGCYDGMDGSHWGDM